MGGHWTRISPVEQNGGLHLGDLLKCFFWSGPRPFAALDFLSFLVLDRLTILINQLQNVNGYPLSWVYFHPDVDL